MAAFIIEQGAIMKTKQIFKVYHILLTRIVYSGYLWSSNLHYFCSRSFKRVVKGIFVKCESAIYFDVKPVNLFPMKHIPLPLTYHHRSNDLNVKVVSCNVCRTEHLRFFVKHVLAVNGEINNFFPMKHDQHNTYILLTECEGRTGRISAQGLGSRTERLRWGPYKKDRGLIFYQYGPKQTQSIRYLLHDF